MIAVWSVYGEVGTAWQYAVLAFLWVMGFQGTKDVTDAEADKKFGIKTIPNQYGVGGLVTTMVVCSALYGISTLIFSAYIMLLVLPLAALAGFTVKRETEIIENTVAWGSFYGGLVILYVLMFLSESGFP